MTSTATLAPAGRHHVRPGDLTDAQRDTARTVLELLGAEGGLIEDNPPIPPEAIAARTRLSAALAHHLDITLTPGHEIAQCRDCRTILDGADTEEDDGVVRCADCRTDWAARGYPDW